MKPIFSMFIPVAPAGQSQSARRRFISQCITFLPQECSWKDKRDIMVYVEFHYKTAQVKDLDNSLKSLLDSLKTRIFWDDSQVTEIHVKMMKFSHRVGVNLKVFERE